MLSSTRSALSSAAAARVHVLLLLQHLRLRHRDEFIARGLSRCSIARALSGCKGGSGRRCEPVGQRDIDALAEQ